MNKLEFIPPILRRPTALVLAVAFVMLLMVAVKVWWEGTVQFEKGTDAIARGDKEAAIIYFERAVHWYLPGAGYPAESIAKLWDIAQQAEAKGDTDQALAAYRAIRRGINATRSLYTPNASWLPRANERIAHLMAGQHTRNRAGKPASFDERKAEHLALLSKDNAPDPIWSLVVVLSFFTWVGGGFAFIWRGWDAEGRVKRGPAITWSTVIVASFVLWLVSMRLA